MKDMYLYLLTLKAIETLNNKTERLPDPTPARLPPLLPRRSSLSVFVVWKLEF
jgi:hypothetical protein